MKRIIFTILVFIFSSSMVYGAVSKVDESGDINARKQTNNNKVIKAEEISRDSQIQPRRGFQRSPIYYRFGLGGGTQVITGLGNTSEHVTNSNFTPNKTFSAQ